MTRILYCYYVIPTHRCELSSHADSFQLGVNLQGSGKMFSWSVLVTLMWVHFFPCMSHLHYSNYNLVKYYKLLNLFKWQYLMIYWCQAWFATIVNIQHLYVAEYCLILLSEVGLLFINRNAEKHSLILFWIIIILWKIFMEN